MKWESMSFYGLEIFPGNEDIEVRIEFSGRKTIPRHEVERLRDVLDFWCKTVANSSKEVDHD